MEPTNNLPSDIDSINEISPDTVTDTPEPELKQLFQDYFLRYDLLAPEKIPFLTAKATRTLKLNSTSEFKDITIKCYRMKTETEPYFYVCDYTTIATGEVGRYTVDFGYGAVDKGVYEGEADGSKPGLISKGPKYAVYTQEVRAILTTATPMA